MMSITPDQLTGRLQRGLATAYLLFGEEPLLLQEAADAVRTAARKAGYAERDVLHVETGFDWDSLRRSSENLSLFASRRLLELRLGDKSPGVEGAPALKEWLAEPPPDTLLVVHAGKLDGDAQKSAWFGAFERSGLVVKAMAVSFERLPAWIASRLEVAGLVAEPEAAVLLAQRTEGNLLACAQEIEKLKLLCPDGRVSPAAVREATADSARFDAFDLVEKALAGRAAEVLQVLDRLKEEGVEVIPVNGAMLMVLRQLHAGARARERGASVESALLGARVWRSRLQLYQGALRRLPAARLLDLIREADWVDRVSKGAAQLQTDQSPKRALRIDPWPELIKLATRLAGVPWQPARP